MGKVSVTPGLGDEASLYEIQSYIPALAKRSRSSNFGTSGSVKRMGYMRPIAPQVFFLRAVRQSADRRPDSRPALRLPLGLMSILYVPSWRIISYSPWRRRNSMRLHLAFFAKEFSGISAFNDM